METEKPEETPPQKSGMKKLIIIAVAVVLVLGAGGGGFFYWQSTKVAASADESAAKSKKGKSKKKAEKEASDSESAGDDADSEAENDEGDVKQVIELPPFIVNLADVEQARYLRMAVSLGIGGEKSEAGAADPVFNTRVRNAILSVLTTKKSDEVLSADGKAKLRKEILSAAQAASEEPHVSAVYITEFIVQL